MNFTIETEQEEDGRWLAEVLELPGALAYGHTADEATAKVQALALRVLADRLLTPNRNVTKRSQVEMSPAMVQGESKDPGSLKRRQV